MQVTATGNFARDTGWAGADSFTAVGIELGVSDALFVAGEYSDRVEFTATNPSDQVVEHGSYMCVLRRGGAVVGGAHSGFFDPIAPGSSVRVDTSVSAAGTGSDEAFCRSWA